MTTYAIVESDAFDPILRDEQFVSIPSINDAQLAASIAAALVEAAGIDSESWYRAVALPYELKRAKMTIIKLYDLPRNTIIHIRPPQTASDGSTWFEFKHVDGMYSLNRTENGGVAHLVASTEITHDGERYWLE